MNNDFPQLSLDHLDRMTDSTGLIQHAIYSVPRRESGYTIDDNARALQLCVCLWHRKPDAELLRRLTIYLSLLEYSRRPGGGFHNLMTYQRQWLDTDASGDCQGQAVRALAEVLGSSLAEDYRLLSRELIAATLPTLAGLRSLRAQAYIIIGCGRLWSREVEDIADLEAVALLAARNLIECYQRSNRTNWHWFESRMTYANAVLPHALFIAAGRWPREGFLDIASESFAFLESQTTRAGVFWPVGNNGWYPHGEENAEYDQQPVEAVTMADAALAAFYITGERRYLAIVRMANAWFAGQNSRLLAVADETSGACCDGLQLGGVNRNKGAESTLAYLCTRVLAWEADREQALAAADRPPGTNISPRTCEPAPTHIRSRP